LGHALATFRTELGKLRRGETSDLHPSDPRSRTDDECLADAAVLVDRIQEALAPLETLDSGARYVFRDLAARHRAVIERLSRDKEGRPAVFAGHDGEAMVRAFDEITALPVDADLVIACDE